MSTSVAVLIAVVAVLLLAVVLLRGRRQRVGLDATAPTPPRPAVAADPAGGPAGEGRDVAGEAAAAMEDVVGEIIGVEAHPDRARDAAHAGPGDTLTRLKGLGPKAAARLGELGVTSFAQMAAWEDGDVAAIDGQMGAFKGRIARDRWVEQARLLAAGDTATFEERFGKLGS